MFDFIGCVAIVVIITFSQSYRVDVIFSLLFLVPILIIKTIYKRNKNTKMGKELIILKKTFLEEHNTRTNLIIYVLGAIFICAFTYYFRSKHWNGIPWLILLVLKFLEKIDSENLLRKALMENGICTGEHLIKWDSVKSYKWVEPRKKKNYVIMKIGYSEFYSFYSTYLCVMDDQKEEVDELSRKMVSI